MEERIKEDFDFPIHLYPEYELNFISRDKGVTRILGDRTENLEDLKLVLTGSKFGALHVWELYKL